MKKSGLSLTFLIGSASGFASLPSQQALSSSSVLNLLPGQGNQLVAAYNAATCHESVEEEGLVVPIALDVEHHPHQDERAVAAARSFASRLFSLPSALRKRNKENCDVVLYPLVGFKFVHHEDKFIALPTKSHVACRLPVKNSKEDIYGWFSPSCSLNYFSVDISQAPKIEVDEES